MRVRGDLQPSNVFSIEAQPKKQGYCLVRFYENATPYEETTDQIIMSGWEYDEYHLELFDTGDLHNDVQNNLELLLAQAKEQEAEQQPLTPRVSTLEQDSAAMNDALNILLGVV